LNEAPETGELVVIERQEAYLQKLDLEGADPFNANTVETAFDRVVMMIQQLLDLARRAIVGPKTRDPNADPLEMPEPEAGRFLIGRQDEKGWENTDLADAVAEF